MLYIQHFWKPIISGHSIIRGKGGAWPSYRGRSSGRREALPIALKLAEMIICLAAPRTGNGFHLPGSASRIGNFYKICEGSYLRIFHKICEGALRARIGHLLPPAPPGRHSFYR